MRNRPRPAPRACFVIICFAAACALFYPASGLVGRGASARARSPLGQTEVWEAYVPRADQTEVAALTCGGRTFVRVKFTFASGGYRITDWGQAERAGDGFSADVKVEHWTGVVTLGITYAERVYDLGTLAPGPYTFTLKSRGASVKGTSFDAGGSASNPSDDPTVFVWQHYLDFLGREPDVPGLSFWATGLGLGCGADAACLERRRVDTSAAFFLSIEFQGTGFLVHKLYRASYGRMPRREEFLPDARQIARGVVVNTTGWEALLADNTRAFLDDWVARPQFRSVYDQLGDAQFVERLAQNADFGLPPETRSAYAAALAEGRTTRAQVLRAVAENADFGRKENAPAFVLMQYFGYLQRNPDEGRDRDWEGYDYWLAKLRQFGGDYRRAEMVKAFISSDEYRQRFCR